MLIDFPKHFLGKSTGEYATKSSLAIPPHLKRVAVKHQYQKTIAKI